MTYSEWHGVLLLQFQSNSAQIPSKKVLNFADHLVFQCYKLHKQICIRHGCVCWMCKGLHDPVIHSSRSYGKFRLCHPNPKWYFHYTQHSFYSICTTVSPPMQPSSHDSISNLLHNHKMEWMKFVSSCLVLNSAAICLLPHT